MNIITLSKPETDVGDYEIASSDLSATCVNFILQTFHPDEVLDQSEFLTDESDR